jgi:ABC-2 type transport system permease protein
MPREGKPWTGVGAVFAKEFADHVTSVRMRILEALIILTGLAATFAAIQDFRSIAASDPFLFLRLFTHSREPLPSFIALLGFLVPLMAIGFGFDSINSEFNRRTLGRLLAQPIYRDALLFGKFWAALATLSVSLVALWLLIMGLGLLLLGVPPSGQEVARGLCFLLVTIAYGAFWLAAAMMFSVIFRSTATSALCALGLWLLFSVLWPILVPFFVRILAPSDMQLLMGVPSAEQIILSQNLARLSPNTLFGESVVALLNPSTRALGPVFMDQLYRAIPGMPLPFRESLLLAWPQITGLFAVSIIMFAATYILFQRKDIRGS